MEENFLTESEQNAVVSFCMNKVMYNAVKKVLLHTIHHQGVLKPGQPPEETNWVFGIGNNTMNGSPTDKQLGQDLKASLKGLGFLNEAFKRLSEIRVRLPSKPKENPAV